MMELTGFPLVGESTSLFLSRSHPGVTYRSPPRLGYSIKRCCEAPTGRHTHTHTHAHTCTYAYAHTHARTNTHTRMHARTHTRTHARTHTHTIWRIQLRLCKWHLTKSTSHSNTGGWSEVASYTGFLLETEVVGAGWRTSLQQHWTMLWLWTGLWGTEQTQLLPL